MLDLAREVVSYLRQSGVSKNLAEDIVQDVFVTMLEMDTILPKEKIRAWLYRVSLRRYIDKYRRDKHYMDLLQRHFLPQTSYSPFEDSRYNLVRETMEKLSKQQYLAIELYYFQGFSVKEIAKLLSCSESKVKIDLHRGRQVLKKELEKKGYHHGDI